jgi:aspartate ammonia-lyase
MADTRLEHDLLGERQVPGERYFGIQTLRGLENFDITGVPVSRYPQMIHSLAYVKKAAALTNQQ